MPFWKERSITDNYIIAHEITHFLSLGKNVKTMSLKLDMAKVYDRMEWDFLIETLQAFDFDNKFIQTIKECISSV